MTTTALRKIVSGGQTGVDRGALDAALAAGFPCGGWCPEGRLAEDGPLPSRYPLEALPGADYRARTARNVADSDATVILHFGSLKGGTRHTYDDCRAAGKPCLCIDGESTSPADAAIALAAFIDRYDVATLNVAGPRASEAPVAHEFTRETLDRLLESGAPP